MLKKLQRKFILIIMSFVSIILLTIFGVVTYTTYNSYKNEINRSLSMAFKNAAKDFIFDFNGEDRFVGPDLNSFVLYTDSDYSYIVTQQRVWNIYADDAQELIKQVKKSKSNEGNLDDIGFAYKKISISSYYVDDDTYIDDGYAIAFVDISGYRTSFLQLIMHSLIIGFCSLFAFFILSCLLSKWALKPTEEAWTKQKQFVADASHELKTPLTVILADSDVLLHNQKDSIQDQKQWIDSIQSEATRMKKLVENMLFLAKNDANQIQYEKSECSLTDIAFHCVLPFESIAFENGIELIDEVEENISVVGNESQLKQLILIFLDNAIKYTPKGGKIYFSVKKEQNKPVIRIRNTNSYIPPEELSHVFERFYRVDKARKYQGGAGLGLSIATQIAQSHKIKIDVTSDQIYGTEFTLRF